MNRMDHLGVGRLEEGGDVGMGGRTLGLEHQKIITTAVQDGLGDGGLCADGANGDDGAGELEAREQQRDCSDFVGFGPDSLLPQNKALPVGPGKDHMPPLSAIRPVMGPSRGFAVNRDHVRVTVGPRPRP